MPWQSIGPVAGVTTIMAIGVANVANLMSEATAPRMGRPAIDARASIISKPFVVLRFPAKTAQSPHWSKKPQRHGSTGINHGQGKPGGKHQHFKSRTPKKPLKQKAYEVTFKNSVLSEVTTTSGGDRERNRVMYQRRSFQDRRRKVRITGFLALQYIVRCLKAPTLRASH